VRGVRIDHVTLAGPDLDAMRRRFAELGLATDYGGVHSNGVTHMALLGFDDGSYLELISTVRPAISSPLWDKQIHHNAGPAAWAVRVDDLAREQWLLSEVGIGSRGPVPMTRARPDGGSLAWELLFPGDAPPGATLPFAISDRTPRELRVKPSESVTGGDLAGVAQVVIGVRAIDSSAALFRRAYGWPYPLVSENCGLGARLAAFEPTPVVLAEPTAQSGWLAERLARYGESPAAFILAAPGRDRTASRLPLLPPEPWFGRELAWIDPARLFGWRVGLLFGSN
jgi:catechol 2,3-dioxygenase-like lactoylglutathione lyase family enzyme